MSYQLPDLPYDFSALEPHIDSRTMEIHHGKHHAAYVAKLNAVVEKYPELQGKELIDLMKDFESLSISEADKTAFRNNGGGHLNHSLFWEIMGPEKEIDEGLTERIKSTFGSVDSFKEEFSNAAANRFGSGWAWLVDSNGELKIYSTPNQDSPYMQGDTPIIGLDVWEHAYYLKYQNLRPDYIKAWWNVLKVLE
ncbi:superoxide dismutase [Candidatus Roizmanbacteria bacterium]|nr:MAG: superoxide dismutase [Candidatus Roizmanbacteria bacterium]